MGVFAMVGVTERSMRSMMPALLQPEEQVVQRRRGLRRLHHVGDHAEVDGRIRLDRAPGSASTGRGAAPSRSRPGPRPRASSQMHASVAVLPDPTTTYWLGASLRRDEVVDRHHPHAVGDPERRRRLRRDVGGEVAGVDDPAALRHLEPLARRRARRTCGRRRTRSSAKNSTRPDSSIRSARTLVVVGADLGRGRPLLQARLRPVLLQAAAAEQRRRRRRRTPRPGAGGRTGTPRASARRRRGGGRPGRRGRRRGRSARR